MRLEGGLQAVSLRSRVWTECEQFSESVGQAGYRMAAGSMCERSGDGVGGRDQ